MYIPTAARTLQAMPGGWTARQARCVDIELLLALAALALVDSLSVGTLLVPLFLLLAPGRLRGGRVLLYLGVISGFYFVVGLMLASGADRVAALLADAGDSAPVMWVQLVLGGALLAGALVFGKPAPKAGTPEAEELLRRPPGRLSRWRDAAVDERGGVALVGLALGAGVLELATMLPYLAAIGLVSAQALPLVHVAAVLVGYCAVMVLPAFALLLGRVVLRGLVEVPLQRLARWLQRTGSENTAWIVGVVGFLIARDAWSRLEALGQAPFA